MNVPVRLQVSQEAGTAAVTEPMPVSVRARNCGDDVAAEVGSLREPRSCHQSACPSQSRRRTCGDDRASGDRRPAVGFGQFGPLRRVCGSGRVRDTVTTGWADWALPSDRARYLPSSGPFRRPVRPARPATSRPAPTDRRCRISSCMTVRVAGPRDQPRIADRRLRTTCERGRKKLDPSGELPVRPPCARHARCRATHTRSTSARCRADDLASDQEHRRHLGVEPQIAIGIEVTTATRGPDHDEAPTRIESMTPAATASAGRPARLIRDIRCDRDTLQDSRDDQEHWTTCHATPGPKRAERSMSTMRVRPNRGSRSRRVAMAVPLNPAPTGSYWQSFGLGRLALEYELTRAMQPSCTSRVTASVARR